MRLPQGVVAYEAYAGNGGWGEIGVAERLKWAAVEAAVLEEAAKVADRYGEEWRAKAGNCYANSQGEAVCESASSAGYEIAAAIRALKGGDHST